MTDQEIERIYQEVMAKPLTDITTQLVLKNGVPVGTFNGKTAYVWSEYGIWETGPDPLGWLASLGLILSEPTNIGPYWTDFMDSIKPNQ